MTEIAENIKNTPKYELPKGYTYETEDGSKSSGRITIVTLSNKFSLSDKIRITFDISGKKAELLQIEESYNDVVAIIMLVGVLIGVLLLIVVMIFFVDIQTRHQKNK